MIFCLGSSKSACCHCMNKTWSQSAHGWKSGWGSPVGDFSGALLASHWAGLLLRGNFQISPCGNCYKFLPSSLYFYSREAKILCEFKVFEIEGGYWGNWDDHFAEGRLFWRVESIESGEDRFYIRLLKTPIVLLFYLSFFLKCLIKFLFHIGV